MRFSRAILGSLALVVIAAPAARAEILVRWDRNDIPPAAALGMSTVAVPADSPAALERALSGGYRVFVELAAETPSAALPPLRRVAGVLVTGRPSAAWLRAVKRALPPASPVIELEGRAKWPHIRQNWVTKNNDVLQVAGRSAQPWIETNAALIALTRSSRTATPPMLTYRWAPTTVSEEGEGPPLESYLVAIAEAGSFGADLLLPLHERLQDGLLLGRPAARAAWNEIRRHLAFYAHNVAARYRPIANIGVVGADPMRAFEVLNLLARHNLPFRWMAPAELTTDAAGDLSLVLMLAPPDTRMRSTLAAFADAGGTVMVASGPEGAPPAGPSASTAAWPASSREHATAERATYRLGKGRIVEVLSGIPDPNAFALEIRQHLGAARRVVDIWNGITVLTAPFQDPAGETVLVPVLNYAHQPLPVQLRIRGTFSVVQFESPEEGPVLLPHRHRDGYTEFVLPALRIGGRVFLSERTDRGSVEPRH